MKIPWKHFYCFCPVCNKNTNTPDFYDTASSLQEAKEKLEKHEKDMHKSKTIGTFGTGIAYPSFFPKEKT